ncbi:MAG: hypothetical protein RL204_121 [Bacteroidota bacterium]|jgi:hypothetical protein
MRLKYTLALLSIFFLEYSSFGQIRISGRVVDGEQKPIEMVLSCIFSSEDSTLVKSTFTDEKGEFFFENIPGKNYFFSFSNLGFASYSSDNIDLPTDITEWSFPNDIILFATAQTTGEIVITAMQSFIEIKADKIVMHPDALITTAGSTAWDVLQRAPGVTVGTNDEISLRGRQGVQVYLDERPMYLSGEDLSSALKAMPASAVESIEIIANPGAKYDAEGNSGIIVIRQKRNKMKGWNGSVSASYLQGFYPKSNASFNLSYRINKFNFFANGSYVKNNTYQDLNIKRNFYNEDGTFASAFKQHTWLRSGGDNFNGRVGVDFYATPKITMGLSAGGFHSKTFNKNLNESLLADELALPTGTVVAYNPLDRIFKNQNYNFNFNYKIDSLGQNVSVNADYLNYRSSIDQSLINTVYSPTNEIESATNLISSLPSTVDIYSFKADYSKPLREDLNFETGVKLSNVQTRNKADFQNEENGILTPNYDFSNDFTYIENVSAAYVALTLSKAKYSVQIGLREETTQIEGDQKGNLIKPDSTFTREFSNLFPTVFAMYMIDTLGNHVLTFNAGRRIDRPNYQDMNPFTYPLDKFTLYSGNPFLVPTFTYNTDISYTYKNKITTTLLYSYQKDLMNEIISQDSTIFYSRPGNLGKQHSYGVAMNANIPFKNQFTFQAYTEVMTNIVLSDLNGRFLDNRGTYWYVGPNLIWASDKGWGAELGGTYMTRIVSGQFKTISVGTARAGVSRKIMKGKGTIKLSCDDLFHTNRPGGDILGLGESTASWKSRFDTQVVAFSFTYRFSKGESLKARNAGGADMEKGRVR